MSNVKYCSECGNKIEYKYSPPKFCSNCGSPFGQERKAQNATAPAKRVLGKSREVEEGFTDSSEVPNITRLDVEIEFENNVLSMEGSKENGINFSVNKFRPRSKNI